MISVPIVSMTFISQMYSLFFYDDGFLKLKFIEPQISIGGQRFWKIEYKLSTRRSLRCNDIQMLYSSIQARIGKFCAFDITFNFSDRLYFFVLPTENNVASQRPVSPVRGSPSPARKLRNQKRAAAFRDKLKMLVAGLEDVKISSPVADSASMEKDALCTKQQIHKQNSNAQKTGHDYITFVPGPVLYTSKACNTDETKIDTTPSVERKTPCSPVAKFTADSVASSEQNYALARFMDCRIFAVAQLYLAYLLIAEAGTVVDGETKLSSELRLKSEGLPVGDELRKLYEKFLISRGYTKSDIDQDLDGVRRYHSTQRLIRLQTAREKTQKWYGLRGGDQSILPLIETQHHRVEIGPLIDRTYRTVEISDSTGLLSQFN